MASMVQYQWLIFNYSLKCVKIAVKKCERLTISDFRRGKNRKKELEGDE